VQAMVFSESNWVGLGNPGRGGQGFSKKVHNKRKIYKSPKITKKCGLLFNFIFSNSNYLLNQQKGAGD
jgi:hypothetical protein